MSASPPDWRPASKEPLPGTHAAGKSKSKRARKGNLWLKSTMVEAAWAWPLLTNHFNELMALPEPVRRSMGYALRFAQGGVKPNNVKPLHGFKGAGVLEVVEDYSGDTYRAVYTVKLAGVVYVLHCFQKKSKSGIATTKQTMDLIQQRLEYAEMMHKKRSEQP